MPRPQGWSTVGGLPPATGQANRSSPPQSRRGAARGTRLPVACPRCPRRGGGGPSGNPCGGGPAAGHPPRGRCRGPRDRGAACRGRRRLSGPVRAAPGPAGDRRGGRGRGGYQRGDRLVASLHTRQGGDLSRARLRQGGFTPDHALRRERGCDASRDRFQQLCPDARHSESVRRIGHMGNFLHRDAHGVRQRVSGEESDHLQRLRSHSERHRSAGRRPDDAGRSDRPRECPLARVSGHLLLAHPRCDHRVSRVRQEQLHRGRHRLHLRPRHRGARRLHDQLRQRSQAGRHDRRAEHRSWQSVRLSRAGQQPDLRLGHDR